MPDLAAAGDGSCFSLRRADRDDIEFLAATVVAAIEERYRRRPGWRRDEFLAGLIDDAADQVKGGPPHSTTYVIDADRERVGRLRLVDDLKALEVAGLQILPGRQGRGIGTAVLRSIMACADQRHVLVVLDVETDNPDAQRLYERLGFSVAGPVDKDRLPMSRRPRTAHDPGGDAVTGNGDGDTATGEGYGSPRWTTAGEQWAHQELGLLGLQPTGHVEDVSIQPWSAVWRIFTDSAPVLLKQPTWARRHEGGIQAFVADRADRYVDRPLAYDPRSGRILLRDLGLTMLDASPDNRGIEIRPVAAMLADFARLQQATIGAAAAAADAGLGNWDPSRAADDAVRQARQLHALASSDPRHINTAQRDQILNAQASIEAAARVIVTSAIPSCLEHGDLWPGNVIPPADPGSSYQFIDFGDAAWSHPFLSLIMLIIECRFRWSVHDQPDQLNINHPAITAITDAYLSRWTGHASVPDLRRTLNAALQLATLRRSRAWINNLAQASPTELHKHGQMPWTWLEDATRPVTD